MSAPPVASLPIVRRSASAPPVLNVKRMDASIELSGDGTVANALDVHHTLKTTESKACDESSWPDKDHGLVCGDCKVLVNHFASKYKTCDGYCNIVGRDCANAWEEVSDTCTVKHTITCDQIFKTSDAICECGPMKAKPAEPAAAAATCKNSDGRRRSGLTCEQLAGLDSSSMKSKNCCGVGAGKCIKGASDGRQNADHDQQLSGTGKVQDGEAADHCCATCAKAPVTIGYFSETHGADRYGKMERPEELRTFQCQKMPGQDLPAGKCQPCTSFSNCWRGGELKVAKDQTFAFYRAEVHTVCPPGVKAEWMVSAKPGMTNGEIKVYLNDVWQKSFDERYQGTGRDWNLKMSTGPQKMHIDFAPTDPAQPSEVRCSLQGQKVSSSFERCQDQKNCLNIFGDGSEAGLDLRNSNKNQWLCLSKQTGYDEFSNALTSKCDEWTACMLKDKSFIEFADKTADIAAVAFEPEIALESSEVAYLEKMAKKEEPGEKLVRFLAAMLGAGIKGMKPALPQQKKLVRSAVAAKKKKASSHVVAKTVTFKPGPIGITDIGGSVTAVSSPAEGKGVLKGMIFATLDQEEYSSVLLDEKIQGSKDYEVSFYAKEVKLEDAANCFDPNVDDMEAWECECMDKMIESCDGGIDEECFAEKMCAHENVCASWKTPEHCTAESMALMESMANRSLLQTSTNARGTLDETVGGKCTTSTRF